MSANTDKNSDFEQAMRNCLVSGVKGGVFGVAGTAAIFYGGARYFPLLRDLTPQAKLATILCVGIGTGVVAAEHSLYYLHRPFLLSPARRELSWPQWVFEHRFKIFAGTLAASALGGVALLQSNRNKNVPQKMMSVRLMAQAAGLMVLAGAVGIGAIASQQRSEDKK